MWYLDCYSDIDELNKQFPIATYRSKSPEKIGKAIVEILASIECRKTKDLETVKVKRFVVSDKPQGFNPEDLDNNPQAWDFETSDQCKAPSAEKSSLISKQCDVCKQPVGIVYYDAKMRPLG